jgi:hypothetical protein
MHGPPLPLLVCDVKKSQSNHGIDRRCVNGINDGTTTQAQQRAQDKITLLVIFIDIVTLFG